MKKVVKRPSKSKPKPPKPSKPTPKKRPPTEEELNENFFFTMLNAVTKFEHQAEKNTDPFLRDVAAVGYAALHAWVTRESWSDNERNAWKDVVTAAGNYFSKVKDDDLDPLPGTGLARPTIPAFGGVKGRPHGWKVNAECLAAQVKRILLYAVDNPGKRTNVAAYVAETIVLCLMLSKAYVWFVDKTPMVKENINNPEAIPILQKLVTSRIERLVEDFLSEARVQHPTAKLRRSTVYRDAQKIVMSTARTLGMDPKYADKLFEQG